VARRREARAREPRSISRRFVLVIIVVVVVFGVLLGSVLALNSVRVAIAEREQSLSYVSSAVAASLIPVVAEQDPVRTQAQLDSILSVTEAHDIVCIRLTDSSGAVIAESGSECGGAEHGSDAGVLSVFTEQQAVEQPIEVEGLRVASAHVEFRPADLQEAVLGPLLVTLLIVVFGVAISALWVTWLSMRTIVEPIGTVTEGAAKVAEGERSLDLGLDRADEIGRLAAALEDMADQLSEQESELVDSYHSLENAYHGQEQLSQKLQRTMQAKSDFVAVASHELRSPIAVIQLYAEMLESGEYGEMPHELDDAVDSIVHAATRLNAIVTDLMDVALLERGLVPLDFEDVDLGAIVRAAARDAAVLGRETGVEVELAGEVPSVRMEGDAVRLRQVVDNLLSNAIKFSPEGSLVEAGLRVDDAHARVFVSDRGRGIPEARREALFEPFGRLDVEDSSAPSGLGLGLAVSKRIAVAHGGDVEVKDRRDGPGTTFTLVLPLSGSGASDATEHAIRIV
jgi:signal transduction histidine kinase